MSDDVTTARRKAMAEAMRAKDRELHNRPSWDSAGRWMELAEAADVASQEHCLNIGNTGPRIYIVGGVAVTDGTVAAETTRKEVP